MNHKTITEFLDYLASQTKRASIISYLLVGTGFLLYAHPMIGGSKYDLVRYCLALKNQQGCNPEETYIIPAKDVAVSIDSGVTLDYPIHTPQGWLLPANALRQGIIKADKPLALIETLLGTVLIGLGLGLHRHRTQKNEQDFPVIYELLKTDALNIQIQFEHQRNKYARDVELNDQTHAQLTQETLVELSPELQEKMERAKQMEFELAEAEHQAQLAQIKAQQALFETETAKNQHEISKLSSPTPKKDKSTSSKDKEATKAELIEKLKEHEGGWLYELCTGYKPLWILGDMGSWKSYCAATIALSRYYLNDWDIESICDPHLHQNRSKAWNELMSLEPKCFGTSQNWDEVNSALNEAFKRWGIREEDKDPIITTIWDELTNYAKHDECAKSASEFSARAVSDPRKASEGIILISHAFTNKTTGGSEGYAEAREGNSIQLRLTSTNKMKPTFKGKLTGFKNEDGEVLEELPITIPKDWFNPESIKKMFA